ncbi:MAG: DEAD/DEAH box helicase [Planctomycetales bacterium]|nr:DEAD/DEAH box helicase [Planctomycetales bacterium]
MSTDNTLENPFSLLGLDDALTEAVQQSGYVTPTPIQARTIPLLLEGRDVLGQAQTGTGKTGAFALPVLQHLDLFDKRTQAIVLTPTRELAIQVAKSFQKYAVGMPGLRVAAIYGGQSYDIQLRALNKGVHVVVGTPGRVMDHMRRGTLRLNHLRSLVLDEADEMLRMGFVDDVKWILEQTPPTRQTALFSATMPEPIRRIAEQHLNNPAQITIAQKTATADTVHQRYAVVTSSQKDEMLVRLLGSESTDGVLVFCKKRDTTEPLAERLTAEGFSARALNGDMPQKLRERIVSSLRAGKIDIIVATDVAARGLDVQRVSHVINYDPPNDAEAYVHRIGRTGRAGRTGEAVLFLEPHERHVLQRLEQATRQTISAMEPPSNRSVNKRRVEQFHLRMAEALANPELEVYQSIVEQFQRQHPEASIEQIAACLATMANGETPLLVRKELQNTKFIERDDWRKGSKRKRDHETGRGDKVRTRRQRDEGLTTYRVEVGHRNRVQPKHLVGLLVNEGGLDRDEIGRISIEDNYSTVDLPADLTPDMLHVIGSLSIGSRPLQITRAPRQERRPQRDRKPGHGGPYSGGRFGAPKGKFKAKPKRKAGPR